MHSMKPTTLFTAANKLSQLLAFDRMHPELHNMSNWKEIKKTPNSIKNHLLRTISFTNYDRYISKITQLINADADPNTIPLNGQLPLAIALDNDDTELIEFLLTSYANPNLYVNPTVIDIDNHQEVGSCANINKFAGKPAFYFARNCKAAELCLLYGAQARLKYCNQTLKQMPDYGNVLTHVIDNTDYCPKLIPLYINSNYGAGVYSPSYASNDGSVLHHIVYALDMSDNENDMHRLLTCASYLLDKEPNLLQSKDCGGDTPGDCLKINMRHTHRRDILEQFEQLFEQHSAAATAKKRSQK